MSPSVSSERKFLSLGVATFNRGILAAKRLEEVVNADLPDYVEAFVIDNCSDDGSYEQLLAVNSAGKIAIHRNSRNTGFAGNFVEVIRRSSANYVLWLSDEDQVVYENIPALVNFLESNRPDVLVTEYYMKRTNGSLDAYRKSGVQPILSSQLWKCSHLPGIVFDTDKAKKSLERYEDYRDRYPHLTSYYPHFLIFFDLFPNNNSLFWDKPISIQADYRDNQHAKMDGSDYYHLASRWAQIKEIVNYLTLSESSAKDPERKKQVRSMLEAQNLRAYQMIRSAIYAENPNLGRHFDEGCRKLRWDSRLLRTLIFGIQNPLEFSRKALKKIFGR